MMINLNATWSKNVLGRSSQQLDSDGSMLLAKLRTNSLRFVTSTLLGLFLANPAWAGVSRDGAYVDAIGIEVPPFHGLAPSISLSYDSRRGNGFVGVGWSLNAGSTIARVSADRGTPRYESGDIYVLDGVELVKCVVGMSSPSCDYPPTVYGTVKQDREKSRISIRSNL